MGMAEGGTAMRELTAAGVVVRFHGVVALGGVDVKVTAGEILGLIGPNGAGKTTMINCLTGFQAPASGTILLDGTDITGWPPERMAHSGLSRTFQGARLFKALTVLDNLEIGALLAARGRRAARSHAGAILERFGLTAVADQRAGILPYGLQRKVALARALACAPRYLLLDEPAAGLNENESADLASLIAVARADLGCAIVLVEHDVEFVLGLCDRVQVLDHGMTLAVGQPDEIRRDERVIEAYLGSRADADA
jgi:branched-chain amino acid transport system ATP-binding protein